MKDKKSILLVEDEASLSMIIKDALEEEDFQVITAGNGLQGIDRFYKYAPDLIIADVMMPEIDGFEMIRRIRKENKEVPVLFLSARSSTDDIVFGFELGANDYVRKPFSLRELVVRAKALLIKYKQEEEEPNSTRSGFTLSTRKSDLADSRRKRQTLLQRIRNIETPMRKREPADLQQGHSAEPMGRRQLL